MESRDLMVQLIREVVRGKTIEEVKKVADNLPAHVLEGSYEFCKQFDVGTWFGFQLAMHDISPAYELYAFIEESTLAAVQSKEVEASGDTNHEAN